MNRKGFQVSIITRTSNRPVTLRRLAENLANQTFQDFEWIIINDAGDFDEVERALETTTFRKSRIKIIDNHFRRGRSWPLNLGLKRATGKYVLIVDDDDFLEHEALEIMHAGLKENQHMDAVAVHTQVVIEKLVANRIIHIGLGGRFQPQISDLRPDKLFVKNRSPIHSIMAKLTSMREVGGFPEDIEYTEDWCFWFRFALKFDFILIPQVLAYYSYRPASSNSYQNSMKLSRGIDVHAAYAQKWQLAYLREQKLLNDLLVATCSQNTHDKKKTQFKHILDKLRERWDILFKSFVFQRKFRFPS